MMNPDAADPFQIMTSYSEDIVDQIRCDLSATEVKYITRIDPDTNRKFKEKNYSPMAGRTPVLNDEGIKIILEKLHEHVNKITPMSKLTRMDAIRNTLDLDLAVAKAIGLDLDRYLTNDGMLLQFDSVLDTMMTMYFNFNMMAEAGGFREWSKGILSVGINRDMGEEEQKKGLLPSLFERRPGRESSN